MSEVNARPTGGWTTPTLTHLISTIAADKNAGNGYTEHGHIPQPLFNHSCCNPFVSGTAAPS
ncbi:MAG: hypothetical protein E6Q90_14600 [Actinobacteria bacterium]|nr:MAG: hypothetical protein E6Q90_14600 [Actinomycetota bacterium]